MSDTATTKAENLPKNSGNPQEGNLGRGMKEFCVARQSLHEEKKVLNDFPELLSSKTLDTLAALCLQAKDQQNYEVAFLFYWKMKIIQACLDAGGANEFFSSLDVNLPNFLTSVGIPPWLPSDSHLTSKIKLLFSLILEEEQQHHPDISKSNDVTKTDEKSSSPSTYQNNYNTDRSQNEARKLEEDEKVVKKKEEISWLYLRDEWHNKFSNAFTSTISSFASSHKICITFLEGIGKKKLEARRNLDIADQLDSLQQAREKLLERIDDPLIRKFFYLVCTEIHDLRSLLGKEGAPSTDAHGKEAAGKGLGIFALFDSIIAGNPISVYPSNITYLTSTLLKPTSLPIYSFNELTSLIDEYSYDPASILLILKRRDQGNDSFQLYLTSFRYEIFLHLLCFWLNEQ